MLKVKNLSCKYNRTPVLKDVTFSVEPNEKLCILGPNGSGKTTLLKAISCLIPSNGEIFLDNSNLKDAKRKEISKKIALMSQMSTIYFPYTVYETVMLGRYAHIKRGVFQTESSTDKEIVLDCLEKTGIVDIKDRLITELSGGQLQRVFLARVFAQSPQIILLDEPTNHLDLKYQIELTEYLNEWASKEDHCVIGVLHDINLALSFANKVILLNNGEIAAYSRAEDFNFNLLNDIYKIDIKKYMINSLKKWER